MNKYRNRNGIRYTKGNGILHINFGRFHMKVSREVFIIENSKTGNAKWLYGWN